MFKLNEVPFFNSFSDLLITNIHIDGRKITEGGLYVPIQGENNDGHQFLDQAIKNGAVASLWAKGIEKPKNVPESFQLIEVDSTRTVLQNLAEFYRDKVNPIVIGITGSNGKTTTKDIVYSILSSHYRTHKTPGNLNNHYGVPLTLLSMPLDTEVCIVEMGMSGLGEIETLTKIAKPNYAIITNIGDSHLLQLGSRENIAKAKLEIVEGLADKANLIYDGDEPLLKDNAGYPISFHLDPYDIKILEKTNYNQRFSFQDFEYSISLLGEHHIKNACYGILIGTLLNVDSTDIRKNLIKLSVTGMRMEKINAKNNAVIFNDAYNASPTSMIGAIKTISSFNGFNKKILVLGDMYELGDNEEQLHRSVAKHVGKEIYAVILVGEKAKWIGFEIENDNQKIKTFYSNDLDEVAMLVDSLSDRQSVVLLKASRGLKLDTVANLLKR